MKKTLIAVAVAGLALTGCGSMTLDDGGRYDGYRASVVELAAAAQETERIRILALSRLAETSDDRTRDRIVSELQGRGPQAQAQPQGIAAPAAPTHLGLEALRILGPGAVGLIAQGIGAWSQNQADTLATQRSVETNALIRGALDSNAALASQAVGMIPTEPVIINAPAATE